MKHLYFAAFIAITTAITFTQTPASAVPGRAHALSTARVQSPLANKIADSARSVACRLNSVGWCYHGVKEALNRVGIALSGTAAWMAKTQLMRDPRFALVPMKNLRKGDILVHGRSDAHPYGHIAVYLGNDQEASDHVQKLVTGGRYGQTVVFRPLGNHRDQQALAKALASCPVNSSTSHRAAAVHQYARTRNKRRTNHARSGRERARRCRYR